MKAGRKLIDRVMQLIEETNTDTAALLKYFKVSSLEDLSIEKATHAIKQLEKKLGDTL